MRLQTLAKRFLQIEEYKRIEPMMDQHQWEVYSNEQNEIRKELFENGITNFNEIEELANSSLQVEEIEVEPMKNLKLFLENWKSEMKSHYIDLANQIINKEVTHKELKEKIGNTDYNIVTRVIYTIRFENGSNLEKVLNFINKEADKRETDFLNKVNKYIGEIVDFKGLRTSVAYGIDGIIIGTNGKIKVETITAGGFVQRRHFRILVKKMK